MIVLYKYSGEHVHRSSMEVISNDFVHLPLKDLEKMYSLTHFVLQI